MQMRIKERNFAFFWPYDTITRYQAGPSGCMYRYEYGLLYFLTSLLQTVLGFAQKVLRINVFILTCTSHTKHLSALHDYRYGD
jgi:hypothetical protein